MVVLDLIRANYQRPVRKMYIKRRDDAGAFESNWVRIDNFDGQNRVVKWGDITNSIDDENGRIGSLTASGISLQLSNIDGLFSVETDRRSLWYGYLNRKNTKIKIDCGYYDETGAEIGVATVFEGTIDRIQVGDDQVAKLTCLSYQSLLTKYDISDLHLTGSYTVAQLLGLMLNQAKITQYIPYVAPALGVNAYVADSSTLTGTYWDNIKILCYKSNSVPVVVGDSFKLLDRTVSGASVMTLYGRGSTYNDIVKINAYDDEGAEKVRVHWVVDATNIEAKSVDATMLLKYLGEPESVDLSEINTNADKQLIVNALLAEWGHPKATIDFDTRFFIAEMKPLDIISLRIQAPVSPRNNCIIWGSFIWGDGSKWGKSIGSIAIESTVQWKILSIKKNIDGWTSTIKCEQIV